LANELKIPSAADVSHLISLLSETQLMTLATSAPSGELRAVSVYFALLRPEDAADRTGPKLLFASDPTSRHILDLNATQGRSAACIATGPAFPSAESIAEIRGVALRGTSYEVAQNARNFMNWRDHYLREVAAARLEVFKRHRLYAFAVQWAKTTDNRRGFGHHQEWNFADPTDFGASTAAIESAPALRA
jgi:uncharacterized protein YhbP (UPF0306 family)